MRHTHTDDYKRDIRSRFVAHDVPRVRHGLWWVCGVRVRSAFAEILPVPVVSDQGHNHAHY